MRQARARAAGKRGFTLIELLVVVAIIALLISILMPSLARARELSKRTVCASNVKGIGLGFASYAAANTDSWPIPNHFKAGGAVSATTYQKVIGAKRGSLTDAALGETFDGSVAGYLKDTHISTTRAFWMLVRSGNTPKSFTCPSATTDAPNAEDNPQTFWDFGDGPSGVATNPAIGASTPSTAVLADAVAAAGWKQISYGYQVPFGQNGTPGPNVDPDMALVSDKGPYSAYIETSQTASPAWTGTPPDANSSPEEWKKYNSPNHGGYMDGEGQNVMYNDGHVEFFNSPTCGVSKDNIFTQWLNDAPTQTQRAQGTQPLTVTSPLAPRGANDSLIYP